MGLGPIYGPDGKLIGYEVEEGQGPTQIAEDLNTYYDCQLTCSIEYTDIVQDNADAFPNGFNSDGSVKDKSDDSFKSGNIEPGQVLTITDGKDVESPDASMAEAERLQNVEDSLSGEISKDHFQSETYGILAKMSRLERGMDPAQSIVEGTYTMHQARNEGDSVRNVRKRIEVIRLKDSVNKRVDSLVNLLPMTKPKG